MLPILFGNGMRHDQLLGADSQAPKERVTIGMAWSLTRPSLPPLLPASPVLTVGRAMGRAVGAVFSFVLTLSVLFALTLFLGWHGYLVATNQTTIEFYSNRQAIHFTPKPHLPLSNLYSHRVCLKAPHAAPSFSPSFNFASANRGWMLKDARKRGER